MSLNWDWKDKLGYCVIEQDINGKEIYKVNIYKGNAFAIFVYEEDNRYTLQNFFADKEHAKNMLGLSKGYRDNRMDYGIDKYVEFVLDASRKEAKDLAKLILDATWEHGITVKMVPHEMIEHEIDEE